MALNDSIAKQMAAWPLKEAASSRPPATEKPDATKTGDTKSIWETSSPITLHGGSLRIRPESTGSVDRVQVSMKTEGRPLNADVELWHGPDSDDGGLRPSYA